MKKAMQSSICLLLVLGLLTCLTGCKKPEDPESIWSKAVYTQDQELGTGEKTVEVEVCVEDHSVTFTLHSDAETLGQALLENGLIEAEESEYGLFIQSVNGILADYDKDQSFWSFTKDGEMMMVGVDGEKLADDGKYELTYTK